jgi:hypothetical protein
MSRHLTATLLVLLTACGGLPDVSVSLAEAIHKRVEQTRQEVDAQEKAYGQFQKSAQYGPLARYAEKESWAQRFTAARKILDSAETLYQKTVTPILERELSIRRPSLRSSKGTMKKSCRLSTKISRRSRR